MQNKFQAPDLLDLICFSKVNNKHIHEALESNGEEGLREYIRSKMWYPEYRQLVYLPPGKME